MTADLKHSNERLRQEITNREIILTNIDAGVVSMDRAGRITTINPAASRILGIRTEDVMGKRYDEAFRFIDLGHTEPFSKAGRRPRERGGGTVAGGAGRTLILRMRISTIRETTGALLGTVITFDDLTELLRAKKAETWQDVARKIAHEVKNPLTPIKLSAERLRKNIRTCTGTSTGYSRSRVRPLSSRWTPEKASGRVRRICAHARPNPVSQRLLPLVDSVILSTKRPTRILLL